MRAKQKPQQAGAQVCRHDGGQPQQFNILHLTVVRSQWATKPFLRYLVMRRLTRDDPPAICRSGRATRVVRAGD